MPRNLNIQERAAIIQQHEDGFTISEISRNLNLTRYTVRFWIRRYAEEGELIDRRRNSGRRPILGAAQRADMRRQYENNGFVSTNYFAEMYEVCPRVIRNALHSMGLHYRRHANKIALTDDHKTARFNFARRHLNDDWSTTIFTDEKCFKSSQHGRLHLWRYNGTRYTENHVVPNFSSGRISANIWGWMSAAGVGELALLPSRANAIDYVSVLEESMLPSVRTVYPANDFPEISFVQDNARTHTARIVSDWFDRHRDIKRINWPAKCADINPIENLWGLMVQRWENRNERTKEAIENHCHMIWEEMRGTDLCSRLVGSMRDRLQSVIDARGGYISY